MARVDIPTGAKDIIDLGKTFYGKHVADGDKSPLNLFEEVNWNALGPTLDQCAEKHKRAEELMRQAELLYQERDLLVKPVEEGLKKSRNFLKNLYQSNPRKLGEYGLDVVH